MNQFRDILMLSLIALAFGLGLTNEPDMTWTWTNVFGHTVSPYVVGAVHWLSITRPWSIVVLLALALTLFMTRLKF